MIKRILLSIIAFLSGALLSALGIGLTIVSWIGFLTPAGITIIICGIVFTSACFYNIWN